MKKTVASVFLVIVLLGVFTALYVRQNADEHEAYALALAEAEERSRAEEEARQQAAKEEEVRINVDSLDWMNALMENTPDAYRQYLENHAEGAHADDAREMLQVFGSTRIVRPEKDSVEFHHVKPDTIDSIR